MVHRKCAYPILAVAVLTGGLTGCERGTDIETSIEFDGERRTIVTTKVSCIRQPDESLVILVSERPTRTVRIHLSERGQIIVQKVGLRYEELTGFVADPAEMTGTKVDDTFTVRGRIPPNDDETDWHTFTIATTCPSYRKAVPSDTVP